MDALERYRGCLLGLAVGDAVGTTLEFRPQGTFELIDDMVGGGPFELAAGEWTDDTSMALCLAASLVECQRFDAHDQMQRYLLWRDQGYMASNGYCFDIGGTVAAALHTFERTGNPFVGSIDPATAGNGSLMRLAPVPLFYANRPEVAIEQAANSSRTTHGAVTAVDACRYFAGLIIGTLQGRTKEELLTPGYSPLSSSYQEDHPLASEIATIASGSFKVRNPPEIRGTGYVVNSLEAALWAFYHSTTFHDGCLLAVNLGDDADTTGAIYGQLAGAFYGEEEIPQGWREKVVLRDVILSLAQQLFSHAWPA